jgi:hypothetical protein
MRFEGNSAFYQVSISNSRNRSCPDEAKTISRNALASVSSKMTQKPTLTRFGSSECERLPTSLSHCPMEMIMLRRIRLLLAITWKLLSASFVASQRRFRNRIRPRARFFEELEVRITPVIGAFDIPGPIQAGEGYDGVARFNRATGALLSSARHLLTAAHTGSQGSSAAAIFSVPGANGSVEISTPGAGFEQHPFYPFDAFFSVDSFDIGIQPLAELAPLNADRWELYTESDEVGQVGNLVGYGGTGTGTIGHSTDVAEDQYWSTSTGQGTNYEVVRFTITGDPTGGYFTVQIGNSPATQDVPYDTDVATLTDRLNALPGVNQVLVRLVGDTNSDGVVDNNSNPHAGSFEAIFRGTVADNHSMPDISVVDHLDSGNIVLEKLLDGGSSRFKTGGRNAIGEVSEDGRRLYTDFDDGTVAANVLNDGLGQGANEAYGTWGDSGSPLIIDGKIAGVLEGLYSTTPQGVNARGFDNRGGSGDFGQFDSWARVSAHLTWLNSVLDDSFDLVLNMETQPWGNDDFDDSIEFSEVAGTLRIHMGGVLRYSEDIDLIQSVTILGSSDDETITVNGLGSIPVTINGNSGDDTIRVNAVSANATVSVTGDAGEDTFYVGNGNIFNNLRGTLNISGGAHEDTLIIDDSNGGPIGSHTLDVGSYTKTTTTGSITFELIQDVRLETGALGDEVNVLGTDGSYDLWLNTNGGNDSLHIFATHEDTELIINTGVGRDVITLADGDLDTIGGGVAVTGGAGSDDLILEDAEQIGNDLFTIVSNQVYRPGFALFYSGIEDLMIHAGAGNNVFNVLSTLATTQLNIEAGAGADNIHLSPNTRNLAQLQGPVIVSGQSGSDTVVAHDEDFAPRIAVPYTLESNSLHRANFGGLIFDTLERLDLNMGSGNDIVNVNEFSPDAFFALYGNEGEDTFNINVDPLNRRIGGNILVDGGRPSTKLADKLNVVYSSRPDAQKKAKVRHTKTSPLQGNGNISVEYPQATFGIEYVGIEKVDIEKA